MDYYRLIADKFQATIELLAMSVDELVEPVSGGSQLMTEALLADRKILCCGNGVDAALAQLLTSNLLDQYERDRPALPAFSLVADAASVTAISDSQGGEEIFARQIRALGQAGDVLVCINSAASAPVNLQRALITAADRGMRPLLINAGARFDQGEAGELLTINTGALPRHRAVEIHTMIIHCLCELLDQNLFGPIHQEY